MGSEESERKQRTEGSHVCVAADLEVQRPSGTLPKHPPISSTGTVGAQQARCLFCLCFVPGPNNNSYGLIKVPKGRKCGSCSHFPLPANKQGGCQFFFENLRELWNS